MTEAEIAELASWVAEAGLIGCSETALVTGFCERAIAFGVPLARAILLIDTLHPIYEGRAFRWGRDKAEATLSEYGPTTEGDAADRWRSSPFFRLRDSGETLLRRRPQRQKPRRIPLFQRISR